MLTHAFRVNSFILMPLMQAIGKLLLPMTLRQSQDLEISIYPPNLFIKMFCMFQNSWQVFSPSKNSWNNSPIFLCFSRAWLREEDRTWSAKKWALLPRTIPRIQCWPTHVSSQYIKWSHSLVVSLSLRTSIIFCFWNYVFPSILKSRYLKVALWGLWIS